MKLSLIGPSYQVNRAADQQRTVNLIPTPLEPGNERTGWIFRDVGGLRVFSTAAAPIRGLQVAAGRLFVVSSDQLYEVDSNGVATARMTLHTSSGRVGVAYNGVSLFVSDADHLYLFNLADNTSSDSEFPGRARIDYLNQRILFVFRDSQRFGWTDLISGTINAISFASAESSPDNLVSVIVDHLEALLFGENSGEPWQNTPSAAIFERNSGGVWAIGTPAEFSLARIDGATFFVASTENGQGGVYRMNVYQPVPISTAWVENKLAGLDLSEAAAYTYEDDRSKFYCLNVPGLDTTLVYDTWTSQWHERCEWVNGAYQKHRATCHAYAFGKHLFGSDDGIVYEMTPQASNNAGEVLLRERISPTLQSGARARIHPDRIALDCDRGNGGEVMMRYSTDGARRWAKWKRKSLGAIGKYAKLVQFKRPNAGRDYVVHFRCTDDVPFNPVEAFIE